MNLVEMDALTRNLYRERYEAADDEWAMTAEEILRRIKPDPHHVIARRRKLAVAECDAWVDPRCRGAVA